MRKPSVMLLLTAILVLSSISLVAVAYSQDGSDTVECFAREREGLLVTIETAALAWPGDNVSVTINVTATQANIHIRHVHVSIRSLAENRSETVLGDVSLLEDVHLSLGESSQTSHTIGVPEDAVPGLLYGEVDYAWSIEGGETLQETADTFVATYVQNQLYRDLLEEYGALEQRYQTLADDQAAQGNATGLMYVFLITTAIFVVTTILLLATHPKTSSY